ncbi:DEAD/DEAH box helicase [Paenibacillus sp. GP183]|uniref:DEAD/DEAH box helicase n=1 Tax=Paenibacillus sp. GP183 TaxID=1882751 RepID=UPI0008958E22|nr:DEAD/DEAH box helicase [Paenibacillus sp. GP183]SEC70863.1 ATP dependent helicase, Lhr family [Paenibacillus sp. GP183]
MKITDIQRFGFHPVLGEWFTGRFHEPTDVQIQAWTQIGESAHTLISSPTGSGKTLAALLPCLDRIAKLKISSSLAASGVKVLYVTPLKALNNDIHQHVFHFLEEIEELGAQSTLGAEETHWPGITVGIRTGDTSQSTRASMLRQPPDLLVTTPESLYLLLTSPRAREMLRTVEQVIVDEIHDLAADKRGMHLSITLERLAVWCARPPQRIGVSATQKPIQRVAQFLGGWEDDRPREVAIVESLADKRYELLVTMPEPARPQADQEAVWTPIVERILQLMEGSTTVLVFANSRRLCERLTLRINDHVGHQIAKSHHGSVAREKRLEVERQLKAGELRCLIATSSLELGIDVGHVDLVIQIDSPLTAAAGIQRIGRAGHAVGGVSRGVLLARSRGVLPELAVLSRRIAARDIEAIRVPRNGLDVLAQQIVAMVSLSDDWDLTRLTRVLSHSDSYRTLPRERLTAMLQVLAGFFPFVRPLIAWDRETGRLQPLGVSTMAAITGAGTIPQSTAYPVHLNETGLHLGELDEEFIHESSIGDVFQLGTASWQIVRIQHDRVYVREAANRFSEIPFWRGEAGSRSFELGQQTGELWRAVSDHLRSSQACSGAAGVEAPNPGAAETISLTQAELDTVDWLGKEYAFDAEAGRNLVDLVRRQLAVGSVPTDLNIVIETFADEHNQTHLNIYSLFGRTVNRTWLMAMDRKLKQQGLAPMYINAKDNGIELIFQEYNEAILQSILTLSLDQLEAFVIDAAAESSMFAASFRKLAETSLLLSRSFTRMPAWQRRLRSEELLREALPYKEQFPLFEEAMRECLEEHLDIQSVKFLLEEIESKRISVTVEHHPFPSPLAGQFIFEYVNTKIYESDVLSRDLQLELLGFSRQIASQVFGAETLKHAVDPEVIQAEKNRLEGLDQPLQKPGDLLRYLKGHGDSSLEELRSLTGPLANDWLSELEQQHAVQPIFLAGETRYICNDEAEQYAALSSSSSLALTFILKRNAESRLSFTTEEIGKRYALSSEIIARWIEDGLEQGYLQQAPFAEPGEEDLWTSTRVASRLIRMSLQAYRRNREALSPFAFLQQLLIRHRLLVPFQSQGNEALREVISGLQGLFLPITLWESVIFPARMPSYKKQDLDALCAAGDLIWMGHKESEEKEGRIAFFLTDNTELSEPYLHRSQESAQPELLANLRERGARFLSKLAIETGEQPSVLLQKLMELVWEGHVSNDQFSPIRLHAQGPAKKNDKFQSGLGRWYALEPASGDFDTEASAVKWTHYLLDRYGLICKDLVAAFSPFPWETIVQVLKQLENWGMVVRGLFIEGLPQLQFTTKAFLSSIQQSSSSSVPGGNEALVLISSVDPANPFGMLMPWPSQESIPFSRKSGNYLVMKGAFWLYWVENNGRRIYRIGQKEQSEEQIQDDLKTIFRICLRQHHLRKIIIESWNGTRITEALEREYLLHLGAELDQTRYVLWPSQLS